MQLFAAHCSTWVNPADAFALLLLGSPNAVWLDREHHPTQRFSVIAGAEQTRWFAPGDFFMTNGTPFAREAPPADPQAQSLPFDWRPGWVGLLEFEGAAGLLPVDRAIVFNHDSRTLTFIGIFAHRNDFEGWQQAALLRLALVGGALAGYRQSVGAQGRPGAVGAAALPGASQRHESGEYLALIERAQAHIAAGDVWQLCLTNGLVVRPAPDALESFLRLRELSPAPYAAFLRLTGKQGEPIEVASSSPEQFLGVSEDGLVTSKPIKGTRPRVRDAAGQILPEQDEAMAAELAADPKERAENLMIVDLMRNDLARVCEPGSIAVAKLFDVERFAAVHQLVSTVQGRLRAGMTAVDALAAAFPAGSMTGAPKLRAIELIGELEGAPRGVYSGAIGWLGCNGAADWGMTIRTLVFQGGEVRIGVGGGITIDSDPLAELEETRLKARPLLRVLGAAEPW